MNNTMTYDEMLNTLASFESYLLFVIKKFDDDLWQKTQAENTIQADECYLNSGPKGVYKQEATANVNKIKRQQEERAEQEKRKAQRQRELEEQRKKEQAEQRRKEAQQQIELEQKKKKEEDKQAYEKAKNVNTRDSYEYYLSHFPKGTYRYEALFDLDQLEEAAEKEKQIAKDSKAYEKAKKLNTIFSYEDYLNSFPQGVFHQEVLTRLNDLKKIAEIAEMERQSAQLEDAKAFEEAKFLNTIDSYEKYLYFYPNGAASEAAHIGINKINDKKTYLNAKKVNEKSSYEKYLEEYPHGIFKDKVILVIEVLNIKQTIILLSIIFIFLVCVFAGLFFYPKVVILPLMIISTSFFLIMVFRAFIGVYDRLPTSGSLMIVIIQGLLFLYEKNILSLIYQLVLIIGVFTLFIIIITEVIVLRKAINKYMQLRE